MSSYGQRVIEKIIPPLVNAGITIVSGFMYGVDQEAHKVTLENGGKTVAVLGWGIDWPVENSDTKLYKDIEKKGFILSEYPDKTAPQLWMFPRRNRIMAGLSQAVLVIEAAPNSGSLITADFALKFKKKLLCVPGPITSNISEGPNELIKSEKAKMITSGDDILQEMKWDKNIKSSVLTSKDSSDKILSILLNEPLTIDEIAVSSGETVEKINAKISLLQLNNMVVEKDGKYYLR